MSVNYRETMNRGPNLRKTSSEEATCCLFVREGSAPPCPLITCEVLEMRILGLSGTPFLYTLPMYLAKTGMKQEVLPEAGRF